jgi:hypothetical protein
MKITCGRSGLGGGGVDVQEGRKQGRGRERPEGSEQVPETHSPPVRRRVGGAEDGDNDVTCEEEQRTTSVQNR